MDPSMTNSRTSLPPRTATAEPARTSRRTHGLTLFEVLVVIAIIVALTAIVLPTAAWALSMRSLELARDGLDATFLHARAEARLTGRSIEITLDGDLIHAAWFAPEQDAVDPSLEDGFTEDLGAVIPASWSRRRLPRGVSVVTWREYRDGSFDDPAFTRPAQLESGDPAFSGMLQQSIRLAVLLPDGGALTGVPMVLLSEDDDALVMKVDPWSGRLVFEAVPEDPLESDPAELEAGGSGSDEQNPDGSEFDIDFEEDTEQ